MVSLTDTARTFGYDLDAVVDYVYNPETDSVPLTALVGKAHRLDLPVSTVLRLHFWDCRTSVFIRQLRQGKDVAGTINGVAATGSGQFLRAVDGNVKASNGYYIGNEATDFSTPADIDAN